MKYLKYLFFIIYCFADNPTFRIDTDKNFIIPKNIYAYDYKNNKEKYKKIVIDFTSNDEQIEVTQTPSGNHDIWFDNNQYYYFFASYDNIDFDNACKNYIKEFFSVISSDQNSPNLLLVYNDTCLKQSKNKKSIAFLFKCKKSSYEKYMKNQVLNSENQGSNSEEDDDDFLYKKARTDSSESDINIISYIKSLLLDDNQPVKNMIAQLKELMINIGRFFVGSDLLKDLIAIGLLVFIMHYIIKALFEDRINTISMYVIGSNVAFALLINQTFIYFSEGDILQNLYSLVESLYYEILTLLWGIRMEEGTVDLYVALGLHDLSNTLFDTQARNALIIAVIVLIVLFICSFLLIIYRYKYTRYLPTFDNYVTMPSDIANDALGLFFFLCLTVGASVFVSDYLIVASTEEGGFTGLNKIFILFTVNISFVFLYIQLYTNIVGIFLAVALLPLSLSSYFFHIFQDLIQKNIKIIMYMLLYTPICFIIFSIFIDFLETKVEDDDVEMSIITCIVYIMILFYFFYSSRELINSFLIPRSSGLQSSLESAFSKYMSSVLSDFSDKVKFYLEDQSTKNAYQRYLGFQTKAKSLLEENWDLNNEQKEKLRPLSYDEYVVGQDQKQGLLSALYNNKNADSTEADSTNQDNKNNPNSEKNNNNSYNSENNKNADSTEADSKEADSKEADSKEADSKEADSKNQDNKNNLNSEKNNNKSYNSENNIRRDIN